MISKDIYYLAVPYSDDSFALRKQRFESVTKFASILVAGGLRVYSPITHSHPMVDHKTGNNIMDHKGWLEFESAFMSICSRLIVLCLPGWSCSKGVNQEMNMMYDKPVVHVIPYNLDSYPEDKNQQFKVAAANQYKDVRFDVVCAINEGLRAEPHYSFGRRIPKVKVAQENTAKSVDFSDLFGNLFDLNRTGR